ncbi:MAG: MobF family relaxase [Actinomycetota bacterium]
MVLTIGKLGAGQERYYLEQVADGAEDYYSGEGEAPGEWKGDAAHELGIEGEVGADQLRAMLIGRDPSSEEPLIGGLGVNRSQGPVPGFDLTFSAPKSVSLVWALGGPETQTAVLDAHQRSIDAALGYLQREACWARRGHGGATFVPGNGYIAAAFRHRSSRAGDPQLHTHVLIANATKGPDRRWSRLHHPSIYAQAKTAGYLYEAQLRHELTRTLGVGWQPVRNGIAEIDGFKDEQLREFSTRRAEILAAAGGPNASRAARQAATLATRRAKDYEVSPETLRQRWAERGTQLGLDGATIEGSILQRNLDQPAGTRAVLTAEQLDRVVTARVSHFDRRDAIQAVAQSLPSGAPAADIEGTADAYLGTEHVVRIGEGPKGERFTTLRIWELEQNALATAKRMQSTERPVAGEAIAERVIAARPTLKADQREMVERLLGGGEGISTVIGEAGTGKSYAIAAAAEGWVQAGIPLRAAAPTWRAANVLSAEGVRAQSIAGLLAELDDSRVQGLTTLPRDSVLLIDEAAMVDSQTLARLIDHADSAEVKLVLVGDPKQLPELEAGGLFSALADRSDPIYLREVIRHHHELDRTAARRIREGRGVEALELYRSAERVVVAPDPDARREAIVNDWWDSFSGGDDALMITQRNSEVERLNGMARQLLHEHGSLGQVDIEVAGQTFAVGDQVVTRVNAPTDGVSNRMRWEVAAVDAERHTVTLDCLDQERRVTLERDYVEQVNPSSGAPALQHAYAANLYIAQGSTVDTAFVCAEPSMSQQDYYVAMSRARDEAFLYATPELQLEREEYAPRQPSDREPLDHIRDAMVRDEAQIAAVDEQLRAPLRELATPELVERREDLALDVTHADSREERANILRTQAAEAGRSLADVVDRRSVLEQQRRPDRTEIARLDRAEDSCRAKLQRLEADLEQTFEHAPSVGPQDRAELAGIEAELADRRRLVITADRTVPPPYITATLGEKPADPASLARWEGGVDVIERHRQTHGIKDKGAALGAEPRSSFERAAWERTANQLASIQRQLQIGHERGLSRELGIGRDLGIGFGP